MRSEWYNTSVPLKWQNFITDEEKELQRVFDGVVRGHVVSGAARDWALGGGFGPGGWTVVIVGIGLLGALVGL